MVVPTSRPIFERLEVVETGRRRRWTEDEKLRIVAESLSGSRQVSSTARRHGISRSLLTSGVGSFGYSLSLAGKPGRGSCRRWSSRRARPVAHRLYHRPGWRSSCRATGGS